MIAIDLPGCGKSFRALEQEKDYAVSNLTSVLIKFIHHFNFEKYYAIGHSLGGHLLLECADDLKGLQKLVLFGTPPLGNSGTELGPFKNNACIPLLFKNILSDDEQNLLSENLIMPSNNYTSLIKNLLIKSDGQLREQLGLDAEAGKLKDEVAMFKNLNCKKYILHGENDALINFEYIQLFKEFCSDKKIHIINNTGHYPQLVNTLEFNKFVADILGS